jgi:PadR family transcriptional regulator PadR
MDDMPKRGMPPGALPMLILRVLQSGSLHGYALAQRIHVLSSEVLAVEEGLLYPTLQKMLVKGWVTAEWPEGRTIGIRSRDASYPGSIAHRLTN